MTIKNLELKQKTFIRKLNQTSNFIRGKVVSTSRKCGKPNCWCAKEKTGHAFICLTLTNKGKNLNMALTKEQLPIVEKWTKEYTKVRNLIESLTEVNFQILKMKKKSRSGKKETGTNKTKK